LNSRALALFVRLALVGLVLGLGGGTLAAPAGSARQVERPKTLFSGTRRIYAFALGAHRISWISRTHRRGRYPGCEMYVRTLDSGRTLRAPLPSAGCGVKPPVSFAPQRPVLVNGMAAWVRGSSCGNIECFWKIVTITGGATKPRVVDDVDVGCPGLPACALPHRLGRAASTVAPPHPHPSLAGHGDLLVYSSTSTDDSIDQVWRIVGRHTVPFALPPGNVDIESLAVGGGAVEVDSTVLHVGDGCGCVGSPAWSPDGSEIAYLHGSFYNQQFDPEPPSAAPAVMNADGSVRHDLSVTSRANEGPVWSPDGKQLAYGETSSTSPFPELIAVANADGSGAHQIGPGDDPSWSPDGSKIAFASGCGATAAISVMNPDGTNVQQLTSFAPGPTCLGSGGIAWSHDGTRIAFSLNGALEIMNANGTNVHPLGTAGKQPAWSPDSTQIVFDGGSGLWVIGADGTGLRQLTHGPDDHPSWSPDGQTIVFGSDRNDPYFRSSALPELYLIDPDRSNLRPLSFSTPTAFADQQTFYAANRKRLRLPSLPAVPTLAGNVAAAGSTNPGGGHEITLFNPTTGARRAVIKIGGHGKFEIAGADSHWIVFRVGVTISALNTRTHHIARLTRAPADPIDLSVVGRRTAWAENKNGHGRIRSLELPS